jgi:hypothetical protein
MTDLRLDFKTTICPAMAQRPVGQPWFRPRSILDNFDMHGFDDYQQLLTL